MTAQKVSTCLWFDRQAEEAARFYVSLVPGSRILSVSHYSANMPMPEGTVLTVVFELAGTEYMGLNGGPAFKHSEAASIMVKCASQEEIDRLWAALTADGGKESQCGWLKDRYGLSWQIVPEQIDEWLTNGNKAATARVMAEVMTMVKLDMARMKKAFAGG